MPTEFDIVIEIEQVESISVKTVAKFTEGFLYGILHKEIPPLDSCITNVNNIWSHVSKAVTDFELETYDGVSNGLYELSQGVYLIPEAVKNCVAVKDDLSVIYKLAKAFSDPWSLAYTVGKNLLLNGVDIYHKIEDATAAYKRADYFNLGRYSGEAMDEVFFHSYYASVQTEEVGIQTEEEPIDFLN